MKQDKIKKNDSKKTKPVLPKNDKNFFAVGVILFVLAAAGYKFFLSKKSNVKNSTAHIQAEKVTPGEQQTSAPKEAQALNQKTFSFGWFFSKKGVNQGAVMNTMSHVQNYYLDNKLSMSFRLLDYTDDTLAKPVENTDIKYVPFLIGLDEKSIKDATPIFIADKCVFKTDMLVSKKSKYSNWGELKNKEIVLGGSFRDLGVYLYEIYASGLNDASLYYTDKILFALDQLDAGLVDAVLVITRQRTDGQFDFPPPAKEAEINNKFKIIRPDKDFPSFPCGLVLASKTLDAGIVKNLVDLSRPERVQDPIVKNFLSQMSEIKTEDLPKIKSTYLVDELLKLNGKVRPLGSTFPQNHNK